MKHILLVGVSGHPSRNERQSSLYFLQHLQFHHRSLSGTLALELVPVSILTDPTLDNRCKNSTSTLTLILISSPTSTVFVFLYNHSSTYTMSVSIRLHLGSFILLVRFLVGTLRRSRLICPFLRHHRDGNHPSVTLLVFLCFAFEGIFPHLRIGPRLVCIFTLSDVP